MASLAQATAATRKFLKWAGIAFIIFLTIRFVLFPIGKSIYDSLFPQKPPAPTVAFDKLPKIAFPQSQKPTLTYIVQTKTGAFPPTCLFSTCQKNEDPRQPVNFPDRVSVYPVVKQLANFSSYDRTKKKVAAVGFTGEGVALSDTVYQWRHPKFEDRQIIFNIITQEFALTTNIASPSAATPPTSSEAINIAKKFLSNMSLLPSDLDDEKTKTTFLKMVDGRLIGAASLSDSTSVRIDFYRKLLSDLPVVYPSADRSLISFYLKIDDDVDAQITEAYYIYKSFDTETSTYPIKTAQEAYAALQRGDGYIASAPIQRNTVSIQNVYLAYFEGSDNASYLTPVFVFEGEDGFIAYVEAIIDLWLL